MARIRIERFDPGDDIPLGDWLAEASDIDVAPGEWTPPMDVFESAASLEVVADLPGITADAIRVVAIRGLLVISGVKRPGRCEHSDATFHLVERSFGRFARAFRLVGAFDLSRAEASLGTGELRVVLPRIDERRGREMRIAIKTA